jgi:hypothetical protein
MKQEKSQLSGLQSVELALLVQLLFANPVVEMVDLSSASFNHFCECDPLCLAALGQLSTGFWR